MTRNVRCDRRAPGSNQCNTLVRGKPAWLGPQNSSRFWEMTCACRLHAADVSDRGLTGAENGDVCEDIHSRC